MTTFPDDEQQEDIDQPMTGEIIEKLCTLRADARRSAENFTIAIAKQAAHYGINKCALRRFVCAKEADKLAELDSESEQITALLERML
jgi:hypothetical protein